MTMDAAKILRRNQATIVADRDVAGEDVAVEGTLTTKGVMRTMGLTMTQGVAIALMVRVIPVTTGEIPRTDPSQWHVLPRVIPVTW